MKTCIKCNLEKDESQFAKNRNQCKPCRSEYNKEYRAKNSDKIKEVHKAYWAREGCDKRRESVRNSEERTIESFLAVQARSVRHRCKTDNKRSFAKYGKECDITTESLMELWNKNDGKCNITGLQMNHKTGNLNTVSIDRIDSNGDYMQSNVQLVCKGANFLKNKHTQQETLDFFEDYYQTRKKPLPTDKHECDCGRIVTDDEWDADGRWCNNCLESYFQDKDRDDDFTICPKTGDLRNNG